MKCKLCTCTSVKTIEDTQFNINYYHCQNCGFIFIDEAKIISHELEEKEYSRHENSLEDEGYVNMFKQFMQKTFLPYKNKVKTVLDYGSGPEPVFAHVMREEGFDVDIYDLYYAPDKVFDGKRYDVITSTEVFEHFSDPIKEITMLVDHLNDGGLLAVMTLFHYNNEERFKKWWYRHDPTHISFYAHQTIHYIAERFNLKVLYLDEKNTVLFQKKI